jgi:predicted enzyme related to lactoylglutathione lyase
LPLVVVLFVGEPVERHGVQATPPFDHGFATVTAFQDPDGNNVQLMTPAQ